MDFNWAIVRRPVLLETNKQGPIFIYFLRTELVQAC